MEENFTEEVRKERKLVIPGELIGQGRGGHNTYYEDGKVFSRVVGLAEEKNGIHFVIPLSGVYNPKRGDGVIGQVDEVSFSKWFIEINAPYQAVLSLSDAVDEFIDLTKTELTKYFDYGEYIFAEIVSVSKTKNIQLSMKNRKCRKLREGRIIRVVPSKVPRIIGRGGSMVEMIKELTGTQIVVGQNGIVWVKGENEGIAAEAVLTIERRAHTQGLTEYMKDMVTKLMEKRRATMPASTNFVKEEKSFDSPKEEDEDEFVYNKDDNNLDNDNSNY